MSSEHLSTELPYFACKYFSCFTPIIKLYYTVAHAWAKICNTLFTQSLQPFCDNKTGQDAIWGSKGGGMVALVVQM